MKKISLIIPAFNEADRIPGTLRSFSSYFSRRAFAYEIIVVDDGSLDETVATVLRLSDHISNLSIISTSENLGKGNAVRVGMLAAQGDIFVFSDADESTPAEELDKLLQPLLNGGHSISIGSRYLEGSLVNKPQPWYRRKWSRWSNLLVQSILLPGIVDPHCGFKAFNADTAKYLFSQARINEWSFDLEILSLAQKQSIPIAEVPVVWNNDDRSKGRISHVPREMYNLFKIKKQLSQISSVNP